MRAFTRFIRGAVASWALCGVIWFAAILVTAMSAHPSDPKVSWVVEWPMWLHAFFLAAFSCGVMLTVLSERVAIRAEIKRWRLPWKP